MSEYKDLPHIYHRKKYVGLTIQNVSRGNPDYLYTGGRGIDGCLKHLNNINSITGANLMLTHKIASKLGLSTRDIFANQPDETPRAGLVELLEPIGDKPPIMNQEILEREIKPISEKLKELDNKITQLNNLKEKIEDLSKTINEILKHAESVDKKT